MINRDLLPFLKTACKDIENGSPLSTQIRVHMVNLALELVATGRMRKAELLMMMICPNHVEMPVFGFLDDD